MLGRTLTHIRHQFIALLALFVALGGASYAATSHATGPVIQACSSRPGGLLRLASKCRANERPVSWNQVGQQGATGPVGPQGQQGQAGPAGPAGERGPSDAFVASQPAVKDQWSNPQRSIMVGGRLRPGSYLVLARVGASSTAWTARPECQLQRSADTRSTDAFATAATNVSWSVPWVEMMLHGVVTVTSDADGAFLNCRELGANPTSNFWGGRVVAVQIGAIHDLVP